MKNYHLALLLASGIGGFFALSFIVGAIAQQNVKMRDQLANLLHQERYAPALAEGLSSNEEEVAMLSRALPKKEAFVLVVKFIEALAQQKEVIATLHFDSEEVSEDQYGSTVIPVSVTVEGPYAHVIGFLESLEPGTYFFVWDDVSGATPDGMKTIHTVKLRGKLYASKD